MRHAPHSKNEPPADQRTRPYNIRIGQRRTSIRLEPREWEILQMICQREEITVHQFCTEAALMRHEHSQTARIRVALLDYCLNGSIAFTKS